MNIRQCSFCGASVEEDVANLEYTVWVSGPKKDGGKLREPTGKCACPTCMTALIAGQPPGQPSLFD